MIKKMMIVFLAIFLFENCTKIDIYKEKLISLSGKYKDIKPYEYAKGAYGIREFNFDSGKWTLDFVLALDPNMDLKVFRFRTVGTFKIFEESKIVKSAYNAVFIEDKKFLTLLTNDKNLVDSFGLGNCGLEILKEIDISKNGCSAWKSVSICNEDHDLLFLDENGKLFFGVRPMDNDMCTAEKRPTSLTPPVEKL